MRPQGQRVQKIAQGVGASQQRLGKTPIECTLDPQHQLHARQAVETEVSIEPAVQRYPGDGAPGVQLPIQLCDDAQEPLGGIRPGDCRRVHGESGLCERPNELCRIAARSVRRRHDRTRGRPDPAFSVRARDPRAVHGQRARLRPSWRRKRMARLRDRRSRPISGGMRSMSCSGSSPSGASSISKRRSPAARTGSPRESTTA